APPNQATSLESQMIHKIQLLPGQTLKPGLPYTKCARAIRDSSGQPVEITTILVRFAGIGGPHAA
ncbi:MAG: hypothetical protein K2X57_01215, partial [Xanthobacteraceae bacterium]|nr:hypothetical protein [Xanthobacteraceae bacterium]